jgi:hypothetical protein
MVKVWCPSVEIYSMIAEEIRSSFENQVSIAFVSKRKVYNPLP